MTRPWAPRPRHRPPWWPDGEEWPPREWRHGSDRQGYWGGGHRRRGPRPFGCLFVLLILLVAGLFTSAVWALAALAGLVSAPPFVVAGGAFVVAGAVVSSLPPQPVNISELPLRISARHELRTIIVFFI